MWLGQQLLEMLDRAPEALPEWRAKLLSLVLRTGIDGAA
jgi:hypothetical protein